MSKQDKKKAIIALLGETNAGKSTLFNYWIGKKIAIVTPRKNTTNKHIFGLYEEPNFEAIFIDTPGFIERKQNLQLKELKSLIFDASQRADINLFLLPFWKIDNLNRIKAFKNDKTNILLITKIDQLKDQEILYKLAKKADKLNYFEEIIPISTIKRINIEKLLTILKKYSHFENEEFDDLVNDKKIWNFSDIDYFSEIIREKIIIFMNNELPYQVNVEVTNVQDKENRINVNTNLLVTKKEVLKILIASDALLLKKIRNSAQIEAQKFYQKSIFIDFHIKVNKKEKS